MGSTILENLETKRWKWEIAQTMGGCQVVYFLRLDPGSTAVEPFELILSSC
jgi:hypothetical protein